MAGSINSRTQLRPEDVEHKAILRRPLRARGIRRVEVLLDATEHLLAQTTETDISLATIAEQARVPIPSVYHFFPNRNAALVALAGRYHRDLAQIGCKPLEPEPTNWQDMVRMRQRDGANYLNDHPAALRLFMGAGVSVEVRNLDLSGNAQMALNRADQWRKRFECSTITKLDFRLAVVIGLTDGIWAISYSQHGRITDEYVSESCRAAIAYLRSFLPEELALIAPNSLQRR